MGCVWGSLLLSMSQLLDLRLSGTYRSYHRTKGFASVLLLASYRSRHHRRRAFAPSLATVRRHGGHTAGGSSKTAVIMIVHGLVHCQWNIGNRRNRRINSEKLEL